MSPYFQCDEDNPCPSNRFYCQDKICHTCSSLCTENGVPVFSSRCQDTCPDFYEEEFPKFLPDSHTPSTIHNVPSTDSSVTSMESNTTAIQDSFLTVIDSASSCYIKDIVISVLCFALLTAICFMIIYCVRKTTIVQRLKKWIISFPICSYFTCEKEKTVNQEDTEQAQEIVELLNERSSSAQSGQNHIAYQDQNGECPSLGEAALLEQRQNVKRNLSTTPIEMDVFNVKNIEDESTQTIAKEVVRNVTSEPVNVTSEYTNITSTDANIVEGGNHKPDASCHDNAERVTPSATPPGIPLLFKDISPEESFLSHSLKSRDCPAKEEVRARKQRQAQEHVMPYEISYLSEKSKFPIPEQAKSSLSNEPGDLSKYPISDKGPMPSHQVIAINSCTHVNPVKHNRNNNNISSPTEDQEIKHTPSDNCRCGCTDTTVKMPD